jgi:hypothetical protein
MLYQVNENQLKAINTMIKIINLALKRNCFSEQEKELILQKLANINLI